MKTALEGFLVLIFYCSEFIIYAQIKKHRRWRTSLPSQRIGRDFSVSAKQSKHTQRCTETHAAHTQHTHTHTHTYTHTQHTLKYHAVGYRERFVDDCILELEVSKSGPTFFIFKANSSTQPEHTLLVGWADISSYKSGAEREGGSQGQAAATSQGKERKESVHSRQGLGPCFDR